MPLCGGLMYLAESLTDLEGRCGRWPASSPRPWSKAAHAELWISVQFRSTLDAPTD